jgi:hypothetical protein
MRRMHKPDPKFLPDQQEKRSIVAIEESMISTWLNGSIEEAKALIALTPVEKFNAAPAGAV